MTLWQVSNLICLKGDNDLNQVENIPTDGPIKDTDDLHGEEETDLTEIEAELEGLDVDGKEEYIEEVKDRLEKGESLDEIKKEIAEAKQPQEDEEEFVTKSKHEKTIKKMESRIAKLTAERNATKVTATPKTDEEKIENMSAEELDAVQDQIQLKMRREENDETWLQLQKLSKQVEQAKKSQPQRFQQSQLKI